MQVVQEDDRRAALRSRGYLFDVDGDQRLRKGPEFLDDVRQRAAFHVLQNDIVVLVSFYEIDILHDIFVLELFEQVYFRLDLLERGLVFEIFQAYLLYGNYLPILCIQPFVHGADRALPDHISHLVVADFLRLLDLN